MTPYRPLLEVEFQRIEAALEAVSDAWTTDWFAEGTPAQITLTASKEPLDSNGAWARVQLGNHHLASIESNATTMAVFAAALAGQCAAAAWPDADHDRVAMRLVHDALGGLVLRIAAQSGALVIGAVEPLPEALRHRGSTNVALTIRYTDVVCARLLITREALERFLIPPREGRRHDRADLVRRGVAVQPIETHLSVVLARESMPLGDVRDLKVGHVLTFNKRIDEALEVWIGGAVRGHCYLGRTGEFRAIRLTSDE